MSFINSQPEANAVADLFYLKSYFMCILFDGILFHVYVLLWCNVMYIVLHLRYFLCIVTQNISFEILSPVKLISIFE